MISSFNKAIKSPLMVGACITTLVTVAGTFYVILQPRFNPSAPTSARSTTVAMAMAPNCRTIVNDPQPPLNVRSSPAERANNVVGQVKNGEVLTVTGDHEGWFQVTSPLSGWVDQALTKTTCGNPGQVDSPDPQPVRSDPPASPQTDQGDRILLKAVALYQAGDLSQAIALAKTIPSSSSAHSKAQKALKTMPTQWKQAQSLYNKAEKALRQSKWEVVLKLVDEFPDIRFWREKLAPLVKKAIYLRQTALPPSTPK